MIGPTTAETPLKNEMLENAIPVYSGLLPAHSVDALIHVAEKPPLWRGQVSVCGLGERRRGTYEGAEHDSKDVEVSRRACEAPEEEGRQGAADGAREHDGRVGKAVGEVPEADLPQHHRQVEHREDNSRGELICDIPRKCSDVERDGEVREALHERSEDL